MPAVSYRTLMTSQRGPRRPTTGLRGLTLTWPFLVLLLFLAVFLGSGALPAQTPFEGMQHTPLGNATLLVQPGASGNDLSVSNIGSSGQDGVSIDLGEVAGVMMDGPLSLAPSGSTLSFAPEGWALSSPVALGALVATRNSNGDLELTVDFGQTGATAFDVEILSQGCVVGESAGLPGPLAAVVGLAGGGADQIGVAIREDLPGVNRIVYTWTLEAPATIGVPGFSPVMGKEIRVTFINPAPDAITAVNVTGVGPDPWVITRERIGIGPDPNFGVAGVWHRALGMTRFDTTTTAGSLRLYDLDVGPSNLPRYSLTNGSEMGWLSAGGGWDPLAPTLPFGASIEWKTVGNLGGQTGEELASATSTKTASGWDTVFDWTPVQPASLSVEVWDGSTQVLGLGGLSQSTFSVLSNEPVSFDIGDPVSMLSQRLEVAVSSPITVTIGGSPITVMGDRIMIEPKDGAVEPQSMNRLVLLTNAISELTLTGAEVAPLPFSLSLTQDSMTLDVDIAIDGATPSSPYFIFYAFDPMNGTAPGMGSWGGLWITVPELLDQLQYAVLGIPIFGGTIDSCGQMASTIPGLPSLPGLTAYSIALTFDGGGNWLFSGVEMLMLQ